MQPTDFNSNWNCSNKKSICISFYLHFVIMFLFHASQSNTRRKISTTGLIILHYKMLYITFFPFCQYLRDFLQNSGEKEAMKHESILTYILSLASSLIRKTDLHYRYLFFLNLMLKYVFIAKAVFNIYFYYKNKLYFK